MSKTLHYLICYDIRDDSRRSAIAKALEDYGTRVQYSVFECSLSEKKLIDLRILLLKEMDQNDDSIRIYNLCNRCASGIEYLGASTILNEDEIIVV